MKLLKLPTALLLLALLPGCHLLPKKTPPATAAAEAEQTSEEPIPGPSDLPEALPTEPEQPVKMKDPRPLWKRVLFFWKSGPKPPRASALTSVASVYSVNPAGNFAILESMAAASMLPGTRLAVIQDGVVMSILRVTPDRRPPFLIADIVSGEPQRGEALYVIE